MTNADTPASPDAATEPQPAAPHSRQEQERRATAAADQATGRKWCAGCASYRALFGGGMRPIQGGRRQQWRCSTCRRPWVREQQLLAARRVIIDV